MEVIKANGEREKFNVKKVRASLKRVSVPATIRDRIVKSVTDKIHDGISTRELYRMVFRELKKQKGGFAGKYNLKKALIELGPSGYPFENYIGRLWESGGFAVEVGSVVEGRCVSHEVDVRARKGNLVHFVECKHHSSQRNFCNVRNPLYFYARFLDLRKVASVAENSRLKCKGYLVTNTRFTSEAMLYGHCVGLKLISWNHPPNSSLREQIDRAGLHPITCLSTISKSQKQALIDRGVVLCMDICRSPDVLLEIGIKNEKTKRVLEEGAAVCGIPASNVAH
ncbi:MAG: hypothetical protein J5I65_11700 [Aridibacter famidurans]|nr:hypothetical protein [Aridibacter famidurans]